MTTDIINNYANKHKVTVEKTFADYLPHDPFVYGVHTVIVGEYSNDGTDQHNFEWFATQEEQQSEYEKVIREVSRGEWV